MTAAWRRLSLRWRLMLIGTAGLAAGFALGGALLVAALSISLERSLDAGADRTASDVAGLIAAGQLPEPVPVAGLQLVQVVDPEHRVRASSPGVDRLVPLLQPPELARAHAGERLEVDGDRAGLDGSLRVLAVRAGPAGGQLTVLVASPLDDVQQGPRLLRQALLLGFAPILVLLAAVAWWVIGLTLRPVEALRAGAEDITERDGAGRLPLPGGEDEIHRLATTLNGMLDRLEAARRRQREFVADAAHELRNPLAGMRTQLEVAQRHPEGTVWPDVAADLLIDIERLTRLADDLLLLARADETAARAPGSHPASPVDLGPLLAHVAARYRDARVPVRVAGPPGGNGPVDDVRAWADPEDLHRVVVNLVDNAVRHARTAVEVEARADGERALVTVTDDGAGIGEADRRRVFDRFTRLDDARTAHDGGAGLGLAIVAELVRRHGGAVELHDARPGVRAIVWLRRDVENSRDVSPSGATAP